MSNKDSFEWNRVIQELTADADGEDDIELIKKRAGELQEMANDPKMHELCKCQAGEGKWKHHQTYCPIWKNGRIAELENAVKEVFDLLDDDTGWSEFLEWRHDNEGILAK